MIIIEGEWKSQINDNLFGKLSILIEHDHLSNDMIGIVKLVHLNEHHCIDNFYEFSVEIKYDRQLESIFNEQIIIDRLFIRQKNFDIDIYYTMQITSYNGHLWQGSYVTIYPNDLGQLSDLQFIISCSIAEELTNKNSYDKNYTKRRKLTIL